MALVANVIEAHRDNTTAYVTVVLVEPGDSMPTEYPCSTPLFNSTGSLKTTQEIVDGVKVDLAVRRKHPIGGFVPLIGIPPMISVP